MPPSPSREPRSAAVQALWHAYAEWLMTLDHPVRDDEDHDDSWDGFLRDRRKSKEKARLRLVEVKRNEQRRADKAARPQEQPEEQTRQPVEPTAGQQRWAVATAQRLEDYFDWLETIPIPARDDRRRRDESWDAFMGERTERREQQYNAKRRKGTKRGRPVDPSSQRQQQLAAREAARKSKAERAAEAQARSDRVWGPRINKLRALGAINAAFYRSEHDERPHSYVWLLPVPLPAKLPDWIFCDAGWQTTVCEHVPERIRQSLGPTKRCVIGDGSTEGYKSILISPRPKLLRDAAADHERRMERRRIEAEFAQEASDKAARAEEMEWLVMKRRKAQKRGVRLPPDCTPLQYLDDESDDE